jgi:transcriptional regulator with XRE-family HTH domain
VGFTSGEATSREDLAGEVRERVARTAHDLRIRSGRSLAEVASAAGIGKSTLHAIEAGDANPGIETLWALAQALGVAFGDLLDPPRPPVRVVRAGDAPRIAAEASAMQAFLMTTTAHGARVEVFRLELGPGPGRVAAAHTSGTIEHVLVTHGRLQVGPVEAMVELGPGDLVTFPGDVEHRYEALDGTAHAVLLVEYA